MSGNDGGSSAIDIYYLREAQGRIQALEADNARLCIELGEQATSNNTALSMSRQKMLAFEAVNERLRGALDEARIALADLGELRLRLNVSELELAALKGEAGRWPELLQQERQRNEALRGINAEFLDRHRARFAALVEEIRRLRNEVATLKGKAELATWFRKALRHENSAGEFIGGDAYNDVLAFAKRYDALARAPSQAALPQKPGNRPSFGATS